MDSMLKQNWQAEYAFTFTQGYYFSIGYFTCKQQHSLISVNRGHQK